MFMESWGLHINLQKTQSIHDSMNIPKIESQHQCHFWRMKFDVRSVLHRQVNLAAVNQNYVFPEAMNGCKNLKIH